MKFINLFSREMHFLESFNQVAQENDLYSSEMHLLELLYLAQESPKKLLSLTIGYNRPPLRVQQAVLFKINLSSSHLTRLSLWSCRNLSNDESFCYFSSF